ncbi:MAG: membrane protein insertion efficiency factor YidD [Clostridia bacterium]|nr:membrane protein insertion efficiency factor YidD [Clostridia bacterium]
MRRLLLALIRGYQRYISPLYRPCCRYTPTCSAYALEAVSRYGALKGGWLALRRLLRCHPFSRHDYYDPVP